MTIQIQRRTNQIVWGLKPVSENKFYALVTEPRSFEVFSPNDTIVREYEFNNPEFTDMLYQVMYRVMLYGRHVGSYYKTWRYRLTHFGENNLMYEMVKPKIDLFHQSKFVTPDSTVVDADSLMMSKSELKEEDYKPIPGFDRLTFSYAQQQDDKYKYLYALALPINKETGNSISRASVYITAFMLNDAEFEKYKSAIQSSKLKLDAYKNHNSNTLNRDNADRIQRFRDYFTKVK